MVLEAAVVVHLMLPFLWASERYKEFEPERKAVCGIWRRVGE